MAFVTAPPAALRAVPSTKPTSPVRCPVTCPILAPRRRTTVLRVVSPRCAATSGGGSSGTTTETASSQLQSFLTDCGDLGTVRFVCVSAAGGVLESIGRFDYGLRVTPIPGRGDLLTIANDDKTFECHLRVNAVSKITMTDEPPKTPGLPEGTMMHIIRFLNAESVPLLSVLLMWDPSKGPGNYLFGAVDSFNALREKYGPEVVFGGQEA